MTLRRIDVAGIAPELQGPAEFYAVHNALDWQLDPIAAHNIETRLASYGFDQHTISIEVYVQAREVLSVFEALLNGAQLRRLFLLKELNNYRQSRGTVHREPVQRRQPRAALLSKTPGK